MRNCIALAVTVALQVGSAVAAEPETFTAKVVGVSDGDTLTVLDNAKVQTKIRLHGIDAPESKQDFGSRAKEALSGKVFGHEVRLVKRDVDRYGRTVELFVVVSLDSTGDWLTDDLDACIPREKRDLLKHRGLLLSYCNHAIQPTRSRTLISSSASSAVDSWRARSLRAGG
jgi:hypothetical protein